jgi:hypothetical protein
MEFCILKEIHRFFEELWYHPSPMADDEGDEEVGGLVDEEEQEELFEQMSKEDREAVLRNTRWNVYLFLGIAAIFFAGALFPWPFSAVDDNFSSTAEKDLGLLMGLPIPGEDVFDVPITLEVEVVEPPAKPNVQVGVYIIQEKDCTSPAMADKEVLAREGGSHEYQFQMKKAIAGEILSFDFNVDPGEYCAKILYVEANEVVENNETVIQISGADDDGRAVLSVNGGIWQLQAVFGIVGLCCLALSIFAFIGAQKNGKIHREILEKDPNTLEQQVLSAAVSSVVAAGPSGPPPSSGPTGPPPSGPEGPPGTPPASPEAPVEEAEVQAAPEAPAPVYEATSEGYYYIKNPDGSYEPTAYILNEHGQYIPYEASQ